MGSAGAIEINDTILSLFSQLKAEIEGVKKHSSDDTIAAIDKHICRLERLYNELIHTTGSKGSVNELLKVQQRLHENKANLISQIENTNDSIWSVNEKLQIKTINSNFVNNYKTAFGVSLKEGVSVLISLPEPLKSIWRGRYQRALKGEQFSITDRFDIKGVPNYTETSFNPIKLNNEFVGVACFSRDITEQKQSEEQFKSLAALSPNPISILSVNGYLYVNKAWESVFGYSEKEALAGGIELILPEENNKQLIKESRNFILESNENLRKTYKLKTKSNRSIWLDVASTHIEFNNTKAVLSVSTDITELLNLQEELKQNKANLIAILENTEARIWSVDNKLRVVSFNNNFKSDYKTAFNIELKPGISALEGLPEPLEKTWKNRYNRVLKGENINMVEEFNIDNVPNFVELALNPMRMEKKVIGVACFSKDITEQKRAEISLKESENKYKTLVGNIPSTTYRCSMDKNWTMQFISDEVESLSGYPASDFINNSVRSFASIIAPEDQEMIEKAIRLSVKKKKSYRIEYRIIHKNGKIRWAQERGRAIFDKSNKVACLDGVITDITSRKQAEAALRESEEQYRAIFNSMSDVFIRTDLKGNILIVTPSIIDLFGYTPDEMVGKPVTDLYKDPADRKKLIAQLSAKGFVREFEAVFKTRTGEEKVGSINAKLLINEDGKPYGVEGIARDITYRKMAQKALEERTRELDSIFENTPIILLLVDSLGRVLNVNKAGVHSKVLDKPQFTSLLAGEAIKCVNTIRTKTDCGKGEQCKNCVIKNTLEKTFASKKNHTQVEGAITIQKENQEIERRFIISTAYIEFEEKDRVLISLEDITEMREAEEEIRRLSAAVEQSKATVVITDKKGRIEYVNPQFEKSTGYKASEVMLKNPRLLKSENTPPETYKELWDTISSGKTWQGEFLNVRKDKSEYWESANISPIFNRKGEITHFIAIKEDITERKRIQEELIRSEKELRERNNEKSRYLSILAHDLRGLVGSFHAYSNLIQTHFNDFSEEDLREQIDLLTKASGDSLNLLDNLLAWGKATQGRLTLDMEKVDVFEQVNLVLGVLSEVANNKKIKLLNNVIPQTFIHTDVNVFQTIIRNLVNNAIKFTPVEGSISIEASVPSEGKIQLSVTDTGIGMEETTRKKLFKMGEKVVREGTNHEQGTGLGLIICKEMVSRLGGNIDVESKPGEGSRFFFSIPV
jgi:PAS domain S-box-containing protein